MPNIIKSESSVVAKSSVIEMDADESSVKSMVSQALSKVQVLNGALSAMLREVDLLNDLIGVFFLAADTWNGVLER